MREFYRQVQVDDLKGGQLRFYAECPLCGRRYYGSRLPWLCRGKTLPGILARGEGAPLRQRSYNKSKAAQVQALARLFNLCRSCGRWVCDGCYRSGEAGGLCTRCEEKRLRQD